MKILYILPKWNFFERGPRGSVSHAQGVVEGFVKLGHNVTVLGGPSILGYFNDTEVSVQSLKHRLSFHTRIMRTVLSSSNMDIIVIRHATSLSIFCYFLATFYAKKCDGKLVLEVNSLGFHNLKTRSEFLARFINYFETRLISNFDFYYSVSKALSTFLAKHFDEQKILTIPNGATDAEWKFRPSKSQETRFVYIGSQQPYYNFDLVLRTFVSIFSEDSRTKLIIYGKENTKLNLKRYSSHNIIFRGRYEKTDLAKQIFKSDFLILPPKCDWDIATSGGLSTKIFEYMSMGLNIIVPKTPELVDFFVHGENALLYGQDDETSLARVLSNIQSFKGKDLGGPLRQKFLLSFTWEARMSQLCEIIDNAE